MRAGRRAPAVSYAGARFRLTTSTLVALAAVALGAGAPFALPAPLVAHAAGCDAWMDVAKTPDQRAHALLAAMTIDQKVAMTAQSMLGFQGHNGTAGYIPGQAALCIPDLVLNDAGQGVGDQAFGTNPDNVTAFPAPIAQAASWDPDMQQQFGSMLGYQAFNKGINVQLTPAIEVQRTPLVGRNWEYPSEDPYLAGQTGAAVARGLQGQHVIATLKHYVTNSQENNRMSDSSDVDERTLHEIYMPPYETAIQQGHAGSVMCSYNRINGVYSCENAQVLRRDLDTDLGFSGFVMSDWGAQHSTVASALAGNDMEMNLTAGTFYGSALKAAVQAGQVPESVLNDMILRILRSMFAVGLFDNALPAQAAAFAANVDSPQAQAMALQIAENGAVLLKNNGATLPLSGGGKRIAVIGYAAGPAGAAITYNGGGSGHIPELAYRTYTTPLQGMQTVALGNGDIITYTDGIATADAVANATAADIAVVFAYDAESEGSDRNGLALPVEGSTCSLVACAAPPAGAPTQDSVIAAVAAANPNTVVVLETGGPVLMPWIDSVKSVLETWYPGQDEGDAIAALLFGQVNPSGKLTETFPKKEGDLPTARSQAQYPGVTVNGDTVGPHSTFSEGLEVGYRWYDDKGIQPLFPFGHGLSYTKFSYSNLQIAPAASPAGQAAVSFDVANTGARQGAEVPQMYVGAPTPNPVHEPLKQLRGYRKISLQPGQSAHVTLGVDSRAVSYWNTATRSWTAEAGCHPILVGSSSRDIRLQAPGVTESLQACGASTQPTAAAPLPALANTSPARPAAMPPAAGAAALLALMTLRRRRRRGRGDR